MDVACVLFVENKVNVVSRSPSNDGSLHPEHFARDDFCSHVVFPFVFWDFVSEEFLISGLAELVLGVKIDPQLETKRLLFKAVRHLRMDYALSSSHPLNVTWANYSLVSFEVLVGHGTV